MTMPVPAAGTPAAPAPPAAPPATPVVGSSTGESFMNPPAAGAAPAAGAPAPATPAAPAAGKPGAKSQQRLTLTNEDMKERIRRAQSSVLKDLLGTDDPVAIRERLAKAAELEKQAEAAKVAAMTEQQKVQHELTKLKAERDRYRTELATTQEREVVRGQSVFVERLAGAHVHPEAIEEASLAFARHVSVTDPKVVAKYTEADVSKWFRQYVAKKPFMAKAAAGTPPAAAPARRVVERPAGARGPAPRPTAPATSGTSGAKTFRPGQSNSMSRAEAKEAARARGYNW